MYKRQDYDNAVKYFDEALAKETDNDKKAEMAYATAAAWMQAKKLSQARSYCQKAMSFKAVSYTHLRFVGHNKLPHIVTRHRMP